MMTKDGIEFQDGMTLYGYSESNVYEIRPEAGDPVIQSLFADRGQAARQGFPGFIIELAENRLVRGKDGKPKVFDTRRQAKRYLRYRVLDNPNIVPYCDTK